MTTEPTPGTNPTTAPASRDSEVVKAAIAHVQALARQYGSPDRSLVDELIAERRQEERDAE